MEGKNRERLEGKNRERLEGKNRERLEGGEGINTQEIVQNSVIQNSDTNLGGNNSGRDIQADEGYNRLDSTAVFAPNRNLLFLPILIKGKRFGALVDTGAQFNTISRETAARLKLP